MLLNLLWLVATAIATAAGQTLSTTGKPPPATTSAFDDYDSVQGADKRWSTCRPSPELSLYDFNHTLIDGTLRNLTAYKGEVIVVTNVATY